MILKLLVWAAKSLPSNLFTECPLSKSTNSFFYVPCITERAFASNTPVIKVTIPCSPSFQRSVGVGAALLLGTVKLGRKQVKLYSNNGTNKDKMLHIETKMCCVGMTAG